MDNNHLSDELLRQDHIDPHGVSEAERAAFRDGLDCHRAEARHARRIVAVGLFAAAVGLALLWLTRRIPDGLAIPYLLAWAALAGIGHFYFVSRWIGRLARRIRLRAIRGRGMEAEAIAGRPLWAGSLQVAAVALIAVLTLAMIRVARHRADSQETIVLGQASLFADSTAALRILVRDHVTSQPISGARVRLAIEGQGVREVLGEFTTGADGSLSDPVHVPPVAPGKYSLVIESQSPTGRDRIVRSINIGRASRIYVATDKPVYQPGQTIHMRAMVLDSVSLKPLVSQPVLFEVSDSRGNKVFKVEPATSQYGIVFCDFVLGDEVNLGDYQIHVRAGDVASARTVEVSRYVLPKFKVEVTTDKSFYLPSETVHGEVNAAYFFGKPVANAEVKVTGRISGERPLEVFSITGTADAGGRFEFNAGLGERLRDMDAGEAGARSTDFEIAVTVRDGTGHEELAVERRTVAQESIDVYVFPEGGDFLEGVENIVYIMTAYPDGQPAVCDIAVNGQVLQSDETGIAVLTIRPGTQVLTLRIRARDAAGLTGTRTFQISAWRGSNDLLLRADKAVYQAGETVLVTIQSPLRSSAFFLDMLRNGQTVLTRTLHVDAQGQGQLAIDLPGGLWGTLRLKAYGVKPNGRIDMDTRVIHVRPADELRIAASLDKPVYRPGDTAQAHLQVTDCNGTPVPAALSMAAVDEAVFYVCEHQPGKLEQFFVADRRLPLAGYKIAFAISPDKLLGGEEKYQNLARALFSASAQTLGWDKIHRAEDDDRYGDIYYRIPDGEDYSLLTESHSEKVVKAVEFRDRHFRLPLTLLALATVLMIPLGALALFAHSIFRVFRQMAADVQGEDQTQLSRGARRSIGLLVLVVLFPTVTYLTAVLLPGFSGSYYYRDPRFGIDPVFVSIMIVALSTLVVIGFPLIYRLRIGGLRRMGATATKGLTLSLAGVVLVFAIQWATADAVTEFFNSRGVHIVLSFAVLIIPFLISLALCAIASATSAKRPGRFYAELGRSGYIVLVVLLSLTLVLPAWILGPSMRRNLWVFERSSHRATQRLTLSSDTRAAIAYYSGYGGSGRDGFMGGMGGMGGYDRAAFMGFLAIDQPSEPPRVRKYFPETLLWQPQVITDETGRADVEIPLADSITTWKMNIDAVSAIGALGNSTVDVRVFQDFFADLDLPVALTRHDEISIPVLCYNYLQEPQTIRLALEASDWYEAQGPASQEVALGPREVGSVAFRIKALQVGTQELAVLAQGSSMSDAVLRSIMVRPDGMEVEDLQGGVLARSAEHTFEVPPEAIPNSQKLLLKVYPSMFSEVVEGLESIFRMPHGCFEQTSSVTYSNIMALLYMQHTGQVTPEVEAKAREYIAAGYQKLLTFEVDGGGFDWFGRAPADEKLTAYGILEFSDMSKVHGIDPDVMYRATEWLLAQQNSDGSWENADHWGARRSRESRVADTVYIVWALVESGIQAPGLNRAFNFLRDNLRESDSAYTMALAANAFLTRDANDAVGHKLLETLQARLQAESLAGYVGSDGTGAFYSRGLCLNVETTALAALAMMKVNPHADMVRKALTWISEQKDGHGTWRSTQATVLAMKALIAGTRRADGSEGPASIDVTVNNQPAGSLGIAPQARDLLHVLDLTSHLKPGTNTVRLAQDQGAELPYRLVGTCWVPQAIPTITGAGELDIAVRYDKDRLRVNELLTCNVQVLHEGAAPLNMVVIELGLPPGFAVDSSSFDRLVESGVFARYDMAADRVVLYVRSTAAQRRLRFSYGLRALYPMRVQIPPSCVYEYYQPSNRDQTKPLEIAVR